MLSDKETYIKAGTIAVVNSDRDLYSLTGTEQNTLLNKGYEVNGYDNNSIAKLIFRRLNYELNLGEVLEDHNITIADFIELT